MIINSPRDGKIGKDGITPHIGENNNWFLGKDDTGVRAIGQTTTNIETITLLASAWVNNQQTVTCNGISSDEASQNINISPALEDEETYLDCDIYCSAFSDNSLTFTAEVTPVEDLVVNVAIEKAGNTTQSNVYSTEETVVGRWIDGKPIYRKSVPFGAITIEPGKVAYVAYETDFSNDIDQKISLSAKADYTLNNSIRFETLPSTKVSLRFVGTGANIYNTDDSSLANMSGVVTLEYTKTTDTATIEIPSATALNEAYEEGVNEA